MSLVACPECNRHIRTSETACPFCGRAVAEELAKLPARILPTERLSRAAMYAFTAATLGAAACGGDVSAPGGGTPPKSDAAATTGGSSAAGAAGAPETGGMPIVFYGAPFPPGGSSNAGGTNGTGGTPGTGGGLGGFPIYGAPFAGSPGSGGTPPKP